MSIEFNKRVEGTKDLGSFVTEKEPEFYQDFKSSKYFRLIRLGYDERGIRDDAISTMERVLSTKGMNSTRTDNGLYIISPEIFSLDIERIEYGEINEDSIRKGVIDGKGGMKKVGEETLGNFPFRKKYSLFRETPVVNIGGVVYFEKEPTNPESILKALSLWGANTRIVPVSRSEQAHREIKGTTDIPEDKGILPEVVKDTIDTAREWLGLE